MCNCLKKIVFIESRFVENKNIYQFSKVLNDLKINRLDDCNLKNLVDGTLINKENTKIN
jgi:hypothetical protein